jgi:hypothetical protein
VRPASLLVAAALLLVGCSPTIQLTTAPDDAARVTASAISPAPAPAPASSPADDAAGLAASPAPTLGSTAPVGSLVLGDSISLGAAPFLTRLGYPVVGRVGQPVSDGYLETYLSTPEAKDAPAWVLVLGTNNPGADAARIGGWLDVLEGLRPAAALPDVYWVTPYRDPRYSGGLAGQDLQEFNAELARQASVRPWLHVIDFATVAALHPEWFDADGTHLHPDQAGYGVLTGLIAGADAVPLLTPAPVQTLDGPGSPTTSVAPTQDAPAHPTTRPSSTRSPEPTATPPAAPASSATPAPASEQAAPEFTPAG